MPEDEKNKEVSLKDIQDLIKVTENQTEAQIKITHSLDGILESQETISDCLFEVRDSLVELKGEQEPIMAISESMIEVRDSLIKLTNGQNNIQNCVSNCAETKTATVTTEIVRMKSNFKLFIYIAGGLLATVLGAVITIAITKAF